MLTRLVPDLALVEGALRPASVVVDETTGRIVAVEERGASVRVDRERRLAGRVLLPGFVNAHSHAFQRALRGHVQHSAGPDSFWTWRDRMYTLANQLDPEAVEAVSALAFLEMVQAGYTTVGEFHYLHHAPDGTPYADPDELALRVVAGARRVGIEIVLLRVAYARAGHGLAPNPLQRRFYDQRPDDVLAAVQRLEGRGIAAGLAPHSMRACPADWLRAFAEGAGDRVVHAHVDEQPAEIEASLREHGRRPLQVFGDAGLLGPRFTAVHLTHPDAAEIALTRATGMSVCVCPSTELDLGDGFLPASALDGVPLCIGSDSHALIDPFAELRSIEWHARAVAGRRNVLLHEGPDGLAGRLLRHGSVDGASALGLREVGEIRAGGVADLVGLDRTRAELRGARLLPALVFGAGPALVREVWVRGRAVVEGGVHPEAEAICAAAEASLARIAARA